MTSEPRAEGSRVRQRISRPGLELIKSFEGFRRKSARLPGGRYVVGYGHIRSAREGVEVSDADAEALLRYDLLPVEAAVNEWTFAPLNQNQFDALCSFAFSVGVKTFRRSDVLRRVNEGAMLQAAAALEMWRRVELDGEGVIVDALVRRRAAEKALFLHPSGGHVPAPSAVLKPTIDFAAYRSMPRRRPEQVDTPLDGPEALAVRIAPGTEDAPESDWSPAKAAAASVSARLTEILDDGDPVDLDASSDDDEPFDASFLQAPPSPPETAGAQASGSSADFAEHDDKDEEHFPELDLQIDSASPAESALPAVMDQTGTPEPAPDAPVIDLQELPPFPMNGAAAIEPSPQAEPEPGIEPEPQPRSENVHAFPPQSVGASAGDPSALADPVEGPNNEPFIYLFLASLALLIAAAVIVFRPPEAGAEGLGSGWLILALSGVAGVAGSLWAILGREGSSRDE